MLDDDDLVCGYASKKCDNVRTTKKGGGLHRFCAFHRERANRNQWRVDNKRRAVRAQRRQQLTRVRALRVEPSNEPVRGPTSADIELLHGILFDDHDQELVAVFRYRQ